MENAITHLDITEETCLVGAGGGSFHALGFLIKILKKKKGQNFLVDALCVNLGFVNRTRKYSPDISVLLKKISKKKVLIVLAELGTGRTADHLYREISKIPHIESVEMFCLIASETASNSGDWFDVFTLSIIDRKVGNKSILPWARTTS